MTFPYQPQRSSTPYGLHIPYTQGYDARSRARGPTAEQKGASGYLLRPNGAQIDLWITNITADFSLSGLAAQSRMLREFFPRSFNDVTLQITGNVASTQEYNRLALFIREHHWKALQYINQGGTATQTLTFGLNDTAPFGWKSGQRNVKGRHRPWVVSGYVKTIAAGAVHWEVAPEFTLEFVVAESTLHGNTGIWGDTLANGGASQLKTLLQLIQDAKHVKGGFVSDPLSPPTPPNQVTQGVQDVLQGVEQALAWSVQAASKVL